MQATFPDGKGHVTLYGPERRGFWAQAGPGTGQEWFPRHRVLALTQAQALGENRLVCVSQAGLTLGVTPGAPKSSSRTPGSSR